MDLASYLLKPVQRMGKYALLLQDLVKEAGRCPAREPELGELKAAEDMLRFQLRHGNDLLAMDAVRGCNVSAPRPRQALWVRALGWSRESMCLGTGAQNFSLGMSPKLRPPDSLTRGGEESRVELSVQLWSSSCRA